MKSLKDQIKFEIQNLLNRKVRFNYVNRGRGDFYHKLDLNPSEKLRVINHFNSHPNNKKEPKQGKGYCDTTWDKAVGYLDFGKNKKVHIVNPVYGGFAVQFMDL